jgi:hypothetical protein
MTISRTLALAFIFAACAAESMPDPDDRAVSDGKADGDTVAFYKQGGTAKTIASHDATDFALTDAMNAEIVNLSENGTYGAFAGAAARVPIAWLHSASESDAGLEELVFAVAGDLDNGGFVANMTLTAIDRGELFDRIFQNDAQADPNSPWGTDPQAKFEASLRVVVAAMLVADDVDVYELTGDPFNDWSTIVWATIDRRTGVVKIIRQDADA